MYKKIDDSSHKTELALNKKENAPTYIPFPYTNMQPQTGFIMPEIASTMHPSMQYPLNNEPTNPNSTALPESMF